MPAPTLATFVGHGAFFEEDKPSSMGLDSKLLETGIALALKDILSKVNKLHASNQKFYWKLRAIYTVVFVGNENLECHVIF